MTKATKYILEVAKRATDSGVSVDWDSGMSTVSITCAEEEDIFMQGDEADTFIAEIDALCKRYPSLSESNAALALAEPYAESIWS